MKKIAIILALLSAIIGCTVTQEPSNKRYYPALKKGDYVVIVGNDERHFGQVYQVSSDFSGRDYYGNVNWVFVNKPGDTSGFMGVMLDDIYPCDSLGKMLGWRK